MTKISYTMGSKMNVGTDESFLKINLAKKLLIMVQKLVWVASLE